MAVATTTLDFKKPDSVTELVKQGADVISHNAQTADDLIRAAQERADALAARLGVAEANISRGSGDGLGIAEDPYNPGTYFIADTSPLTEDPGNPGLYTF